MPSCNPPETSPGGLFVKIAGPGAPEAVFAATTPGTGFSRKIRATKERGFQVHPAVILGRAPSTGHCAVLRGIGSTRNGLGAEVKQGLTGPEGATRRPRTRRASRRV